MCNDKHPIVAAALVLAAIAMPQCASAVTDLTACGDCIVVNASRVEIDLGGHTIRSNGNGSGVRDRGDRSQVAIKVRDGTTADFRNGINLVGTFRTTAPAAEVAHRHCS